MMAPVRLHGRSIVLTRLVVDSQIRIGWCCGTKPPVSFFRVIFHPNGIKKGDQKVGWPSKKRGKEEFVEKRRRLLLQKPVPAYEEEGDITSAKSPSQKRNRITSDIP
ncbi:hypothetical protein NPIL_590181 [Nephila pilipes]|uniref:Uncharacterized protein n=1 Tax=Nephila pilipes TaxID=299642 RepID=A0A8X6NRC4_NEPPI|nr:hypothetical protein NPIL_590181 [Nephila pilipes]